jgi:SagB-type dehydrogenase family enzyme
MAPGVYQYNSSGHTIELMQKGDRRKDVASAAHGQMCIVGALVCFVITAEYTWIIGKYRERGIRYAQIEVGHVEENIFLQAGALGLGAGIAGGFSDASVAAAIKAPQGHEPLIIIREGYKK